MRKVTICPTILSDRISDYQTKVQSIEGIVGLELIELDLMDGVLVSSKSPDIQELLTIQTKIPIRLHLLHQDPLALIKLAEHKCVREIAFHFESDLKDLSILTRSPNTKILLSINPDTTVEEIKDSLDQIDGVMVMTVVPGRQGAPHLPEMLEKITKLRNLGFDKKITIDGGVNMQTLPNILRYDLDEITVGSAVVRQEDPKKAYEDLKEMIEEYKINSKY